MRVWLVTVGEPLPTDEGAPRLLRAGLLARYLSEAGHRVVWWSSTFDHQKKHLRAQGFTDQSLADGTNQLLLHGREYARNVSLARVLNHRQVAHQFALLAPNYEAPDVILCSYPTVELCEQAVKYGRERGIPVVLDIRDLWPDAFLDLAPHWMRAIVRLALESSFRQSARACRGATAIFGITDAFRDFGISRAGRSPNRWDATFPMAYPEEKPDGDAIRMADEYWDNLGVTADKEIACFFGTFGPYIDVDTLIGAVRESRRSAPNLLWVLCGAGPSFQRCRELGSGLENLVLPGWVERPAIFSLMSRAKVGLVPYRDVANYSLNLPNKPIEYLSAGLPVVATIGGVLREKIVDQGAGISVPPENAQALADAVVDLVGDRERHARMSDAARRLYRSDYVAETVYRTMIDHLDQIAKQAAIPRQQGSG